MSNISQTFDKPVWRRSAAGKVLRGLLFFVALLALPNSAFPQSWSTLPVDLLVPMNTSPTYPPGTAMTAAIANSGTVSSQCKVGSGCYFATFPSGFEVGANQGTCTNLGPIQMNGSGGALYPAQSLNYNNYAHSDSATTSTEQFYFSPFLTNTQFSITTCMTIGFPAQKNGNVYDMFMIQDKAGNFDVLQLAFSCPNNQIFGTRVETWPSVVSGCVSLFNAPTGTATFTSGSATVTGTGFATDGSWNTGSLYVGPGNQQGTGTPYPIGSVQTSTSLTLETPYTGTSGKQSYSVILPASQTYYLSTTWDYTSGMACYWVWTPLGAFVGNGCVAAVGAAGTSNVRVFSNENGSNLGTYTEYQNIMMNWTASAPTGTAAFTNGSTQVAGTTFVPGNSWNNGILNVGGVTYTIASVQSATGLTLTTPYAGTTGSASYAVELPLFWTQASQTITFAALANQVFGSAPFTVSATASSGLPVSFNSQTTPVCTVSGSTVTLVAAGTCTIQATQAGNASYGPATPVSQSFQVTQGSQSITFAALSNQAIGSAPFTVSAIASSGLAVSFNSQTTPVCTVSGTTLTLVALGTCTIQATQAGNANYAAATPVSQSFQVTQASQTITFGALPNQALGSAPFAISASASSGLPVSFNSQTTATCTVSASTVTLVAAGTCTIQATQAGNANYSAATPVNQSFQVTTQSSQTITFGTLSNLAFGSAPFTVSATASSGLPVSFNSQTAAVCTVSGNTVTIAATGTCTIQATQAGNATYAAATPVNQSFQVTPASQTITFAALSNQAFGSAPFGVSATASSGLAVSFNSQTTAICTVSGSTVTLASAGACTIQATQAGNANYAAATPVNQSFQVTPASQSITFAALSNRAFGSAPFTLSATASSGLPVSFNSQTTGVCTVSGSTVTLAAAGACTIQATQAGSANYTAATPVNQSFQVTPASQSITFAALASQTLGTAPFTVAATASSGLPVSFSSQTTAICTVSGSTVTLVAVGTCTIQASQAGNANYAAATPVNQSFQVNALTSQTITFGALSNQAFGSAPFAVSATASSGLPVSFNSQTTGVCTVSGSTVTLAAVGTCTIQATQAGNATYAAATPVNQSFQVTQASQTITFAALPSQTFGSAPFAVSATASSGLPVSFNSQTTGVCTVSGSTVTLAAVGTCTIQATQAGNATYSAATPVNQSFQVTQGSQTITFGALSNQAFGSAPFAVSATASSGLPVSFNSQTTGVCTVSGSTVNLAAVGTCTIQATQAGNATYAPATPVNQSFQVTSASQTITFAPLSNEAYGSAPFAVSATASSGLPVSFNSQTTGLCTVSGSTVTLAAVGTCTIQATQAGNATYAAATPVNQSFQVTQAGQSITFNALPSQTLGNAPFGVSATASSGLPVSFNSQTTAVCTVSGSTVTLAAVGTCTIQATQAGNSTYAAATPVNQSFQVTSGGPAVAATPTFSPGAGNYGSNQPITISTATSGCAPYIYWNVTGTSLSGGTNSTSATITTNETLYAQVVGCPGYSNSAIGSAAYTTNSLTWTLVQHAYNFNCTTSSPCAVTTAGGTNQRALLPTTAGDLLIVASTGKYSGKTNNYQYIMNLSVSDAGGVADNFTHCPNSVASYAPTNGPLYGADCYYALSAVGGATSVTCSWLFSGLNSATTKQDCEVLEYRPSVTPIYYDTGNVTSLNSCSTNCAAPPLLLNGADDLIVELGIGANPLTSLSAPFTNPGDFDTANLGGGFGAALSQTTGTPPPTFVQSKSGAAYLGALAFGPNPSPVPTFDTFINFSGTGTANGGTPSTATLASSTFGVSQTWGALGGAGMTYCNSGPASNLPAPIVVNAATYTGASPLNLCGVTSTTGTNIGFIQGGLSSYSANVSVGFTVEWTCPSTAPSNGQCGDMGGLWNTAGDYAVVHVGGFDHTGMMYLESDGSISPKTGGLAVTPGTPYRVNLRLTYGGTGATYQMVVCNDATPGTALQAFSLTGLYSGDPYLLRLGMLGEEPKVAGYNYFWRNVVLSNTGTFSTTSCVL